MKLDNSETEITEIHVSLLNDQFEVYETFGIAAHIELEFYDLKTEQVLGPNR